MIWMGLVTWWRCYPIEKNGWLVVEESWYIYIYTYGICRGYMGCNNPYGGFQTMGGTPSHYPFLFGIFHDINHLLGYPHSWLETPTVKMLGWLWLIQPKCWFSGGAFLEISCLKQLQQLLGLWWIGETWWNSWGIFQPTDIRRNSILN